MKLYTEEEADYLIKYYSPKMIGNLISTDFSTKVLRLYKIHSEQGYTIKGESEIRFDFIVFHRDVEKIAEAQNLPSPDEALRERISN